jgi:RND family efflux transporter MFP subunit
MRRRPSRARFTANRTPWVRPFAASNGRLAAWRPKTSASEKGVLYERFPGDAPGRHLRSVIAEGSHRPDDPRLDGEQFAIPRVLFELHDPLSPYALLRFLMHASMPPASPPSCELSRACRGSVAFAIAAIAAFAASSGCHGAEAKPQPAPPLPVSILRLTDKPIADEDEYLASLTSRRSITLYAQVSGYIRKIPSKPGDRVKEGALLIEIDPGQHAATLKSLSASLETRKVTRDFAVHNDESSKNLAASGLLSDLEYQQRHSQRAAAEADVKVAEAQVQAQADLLRYYRITAPSDGTLGDVPVKIGDYVTPQTRLTSVDQDNLVEAYVYVPITKAGTIKPETRVALLGEDGKTVCEEKPSFVSPQVNVDTQTVLVKTICPNDGRLRSAQVLKARMIWSRRPGLTIPTVDVTRQAGQYFAFVVESGSDGGLVARQKPITVGAIQGNDFVVTGGLSPGVEIVGSSIQKIHDGSPITRMSPEPEPGAGSPSANPRAPQL